jgi:hypothetical protein
VPRALEVVADALDQGEWRAALILLKLAGLSDLSLGEVGPTELEQRSTPMSSGQYLDLVKRTMLRD